MFRAFGKNPSGKILKEVKKSPNYHEGVFLNLEKTEVMRKDVSYFNLMLGYFKKPKNILPKKLVPAVIFQASQVVDTIPQIIWFGHSSYLIAYKGKRILVDPVFENASPTSFFAKPFLGTNIYSAKDMPDIDLLIITHDHYDHLEYKTLMNLKEKIKNIICPIGVNAHLSYWGFDNSIVHCLDWNDDICLSGLKVTALPTRHFSGRLIKRNKTLWNSYALEFGIYSMFIGGDSGYGGHFKTIGNKYGPFDIAFIECGQYGKDWPMIHMFPEQTAQAGLDLKTKILFPVHWAKFSLALHPWNEPIKRLFKASKKMTYEIIAPKIGEKYSLGNDFVQEDWWNI